MEMKAKMRLAGPEDIQKEMERFFTHMGRWKRPVFFFEKAWKPLCDVSETDREIIVVVDLAGVNAEEVHVTVEGLNLILRGIRQEPERSPHQTYHQMEIGYGPFERILVLPTQVDADNARATYVAGLLEIRLPKLAEPRGRAGIDVSIE